MAGGLQRGRGPLRFLPDPAPDSTGAADPPDLLVPTVPLDLMRDAWLEKLEAGNG